VTDRQTDRPNVYERRSVTLLACEMPNNVVQKHKE